MWKFMWRAFMLLFIINSSFGEETLNINDTHEFIIETSNHRPRSLPQVPDNSAHQNWSTLAEILDIYNTKHLAKNWHNGPKDSINPKCAMDISRYIEGLQKHEMWALKADDASGRFTNGFFWGNSFFTGSATECAYIGHNYARKDPEIEDNPTGDLNKKIHTGPSGSNSLPVNIPDDSPYKLGFFMMTVSLNSSILSPIPRSVHLGLCLPFSCTAKDITVVARLAASDTAKIHSSIEKIRDQHAYYDIYSDNVFWALAGVSTVVFILMTIGTCYDYFLSLKAAKKRKHTIYDIEKRSKLEQSAGQHQKLSNVMEDLVASPIISPVNNGNNNDSNNNSNSSENDSPGREVNSEGNVQNISVCGELLLSFSVRENMRTICDPAVGRDTISTVHGLRAISMAWVILGHTCIVIFKYSDNMEYRRVVEKKFLFQTITNGAFSVDTFFFMGGLLVSYLFFRTNAMGDLKKLTQGTRGFMSGFLKFIGLLVYRFCRLTAPYMFILGVVEVTMKWFHANSVFEPPTADHENCPKYWWRNLLYINTLFPVDQMCMLWSWYVADDTQFYVVGAVILVIATNHFKVAAFSVVILMVSSWLTTGYIALINNHMPSSDDPLALFDKIYDKPWTRLGPYLIGMSVGYYLFRTNCKVKMSKTTVVVGWLLSTACLLSLLYGLYEAELSPITAAAYSSLSHSAWALGLAWIVIACSTGYGGWVDKILSAPILYPFSRVTYCAYLVHPIIIRLTAMNLDSPFHLGKDVVVITFCGQVVLSYLVSFVVSVSFEAPIVSMLKILSPKKKKRIQ